MEATLFKIIDICQSHQIENNFIEELHNNGLIQIIIVDNQQYLNEDQLFHFERYCNWHRELELNIQGIEIVERLLSKIQHLQEELKSINMQ